MPVDTSLYSQLQTPNPMQQLQGTALTADLLTQAQGNRMGLQAKQGLAQAYQAATDPATGQVDQSKLSSIVSQDPRTAWQTPEVQQNANAAQQGAVNLNQSTWQNAVAKQNYAYQLASSLGTSTPQQAQTVFQHAKQLGLIDPSHEAELEQSIPTDPSQMPAWSQGLQQRTMSGLEQLHAYGKQLGFVQTGGEQIPYQTNPQAPGGVGPIGAAAIPNQLGPHWASGTDANGNQAEVPVMPPGAGGYTGRPSAPGLPAGSVTTGNTQGAIGAQAQAQQGADVYTGMQRAGNAALNNISNLQAAKDAIVAGGGSGPGTAGLNSVKSWLVAHGMSQGDADQVKNYDVAQKLMTQYANNLSATMGTGTDARLDAAIKSNPNTTLSTPANVEILDRNMALEKMAQDQQRAFAASGLPANQAQSWLTNFQKTHGLGVYQFDSLTQPQQGAYLKSMSPQQRQQWAAGYSDFQQRNGGQ